MRRREFIALLGGVGVPLFRPLAAHAQQPAPVRRIGMLINFAESDPETRRRVAAFVKSMNELGWVEAKNLHVYYRWGVDAQTVGDNAAELVKLAPDVILANGPPSVAALQQITHTLPVVFVGVTDPVALGIVRSLAHPSGNVTGFSPAEVGISSKWLELLKEIAPNIRRAVVLHAAGNVGGEEQVGAIKAAAPSLAIDISLIDVGNPDEIERSVGAFAQSPNGGLIMLRIAEDIAARRQIIALADRYRLPAVYPLRFCATEGGLVSYGPDVVDEYRQAAGYIDRILKGEKPGELPVQSSTKFELVVNLKTAKALGLTIPPTLLATADEVIE